MRYADYTCDDRGVCLCACNAASIGITVQKWLNGSTLLGPKEHCVRWGILIPLLCLTTIERWERAHPPISGLDYFETSRHLYQVFC